MKKECPICGSKSLVEKSGTFRFEPPANIPGGAIIVPNSKWQECQACGESILAQSLLEKLEEQRYARLELLTPEQIKHIRQAAGLTQSQIAEKLGIGEKTYTRWETGKCLQNKSSDNLIRLFAKNPAMFDALKTECDFVSLRPLWAYFEHSIQSDYWCTEKTLAASAPAFPTKKENFSPAA